MQASGHYSLLAKTKYAWPIYGTTAIKSGHVIAWKAIVTVQAAGLRGALMRNNSSSLPGLKVSQPVNSLAT